MSHRPLHPLLLALGLLASWPAPAVPASKTVVSTTVDRASLRVTVYGDFALVDEERWVALPGGTVELRALGVPERLEPGSVRLRNGSGSWELLEQSFRFDPPSRSRLLAEHVGREVTLVRRRVVDGEKRTDVTVARLVSFHGNEPVWEIDGRIVVDPVFDELRFDRLPEDVNRVPELYWRLERRGAARERLRFGYLTGGVGWRADYVLHVDDERRRGTLDGWATVQNRSGADLAHAELALVAGDVRRVAVAPRAEYAVRAMDSAAAPSVRREAFAGYHRYRMRDPVDLPDGASKQLPLMPPLPLEIEEQLVVRGQPQLFRQPVRFGEPQRSEVEMVLAFDSGEGAGAGAPLPAGIVRVYQGDEEIGFAGEDMIDHTPAGEQVRVRIGSAFDIVAERMQIDFKRIADDVHESTHQVTLRNRRDANAEVTVLEPAGGDWEVIASSHPAERASAGTIRFDVSIPAGESVTLEYRVRVRR